MVGFLSASFLGLGFWFLYVLSGIHNRWLGLLAEEATIDAVSGWKSRLEGWDLVQGLYFKGHGDVDHVLVGPGGVFAIESKWTSLSWSVTADRIVGPPGRDPLTQALDGAKKVELMLRHGKDKFDIVVHPVVVLWGPGAPTIEEGWTEASGVLVVEGRSGRLWLEQLRRADLSRPVVEAMAGQLRTQSHRQRAVGVG